MAALTCRLYKKNLNWNALHSVHSAHAAGHLDHDRALPLERNEYLALNIRQRR